ncbi:glycine-rich domain-containing protein [Streptomyces achromogenes]|uniref:glycine-rich domain-containing protein n=1 Tax=Streptomyces achromogenes TaxID=67255 RepID=UPI0036983741
MTITQYNPVEVQDLLDPALRPDLITFVREEYWPELTDDLGERGVDQLVAFLAATRTTDHKMTPSLRVDQFWHGFVLHTKPYADFCAGLGQFIHHVPDRGRHNPKEGRKALALTVETIRAAGFTIDPEFWPNEGAADCTQSYAGCSDSPVNK